MSIEVIKETFKVEELRGSEEAQVLVETEVYLNTLKPDIERFLWVEGRPEILSTKIIKDKLIINGLAKFNLVYIGLEDEGIHTIQVNKDFKEEIEILGITEDMSSAVNTKVEYIEYELEETKIVVRALINVLGEVEEIKTLEIIKDVRGKEELQFLKESIKYKEIHGKQFSYAEIRERVKTKDENPNVEKILKFEVEAKEVESMVVEDRIILSGEALVTIIYLGDEKISSLAETIPFNHFVDIPEAHRELKGKIDLEVVEGLYDVIEDEMGDPRIIDLEIKIRVTGKAYENKNRELIVDAYSTKDNLLLDKEEISFKEDIENIHHKEMIIRDIDAIDPKEIFDVRGNLNIIDKKYLDGEIVVEGILSLDIYYEDRISEEAFSYKDDFPYNIKILQEDFKVNTVIDIDYGIDKIEYSLKKDSIIIESSIFHNIHLSQEKIIYGIKDIKETDEIIDKKNQPSIVIYIVQKGDILWDIAKRYNTTREEILSSNNLDGDYELKVGDKIIIEKKVELIF